MKIAHLFELHGAYAVRNPCVILCIALVVAVITNLGLLNLDIENSPETLWVSPTGIASRNEKYFNEKYGTYYRVNQLIFHPSGSKSDGEDLFQKDYLKELWYLQMAIESRTIEYDNVSYSVNDLCFKPIPGQGCATQSPLEYWHLDFDLLESDPDVKNTATCLDSKFKDQMACMSRAGFPVTKQIIMGNPGCAGDTQDTDCTVCKPTAKALLVTFLLDSNKYSEDLAARWEKEVFESCVDQFNAGNLKLSDVDVNITFSGNTKASYLSQRSISDELEDQTKSNAVVVIISYSLMFFYIATAMGSFPNKVHSGFLLGLGGIFIVILSVSSSIGLLSYLGVGISMISAEVVPFLILAIGVDNMFIISDSYKRVIGNTIEEKMSHALYEAGPSITAAAFCEFLAFIVGASTDIIALQGFCFNAAVAVVFNYFYQITAFVVFLTLDQKRKAQGRADILFCIGVDEPTHPPQHGVVYNIMNKYYVPFLFSKGCQIVSMIIFVGLIILGIVGYNFMSLGLEQQTSVTKDGVTYNYFGDLAKYLATGPEAFIVFEGVDWSNKTTLKTISGMVDEVSRYNRSVMPPVYSWVNNFQQTLQTNIALPNLTKDCGSEGWGNLPIDEALYNYVQISLNSTCCRSYGICGMQYQQDVAFDLDKKVTSARFRFFHTSTNTQEDFLDAYLGTTSIVDKWSKKLPEGNSAFAYSLFYVYFEQYGFIKGVAFQNLLLACGAVFGAVVMLKNAYSGLFIFICTFFSAFDMIGLLWLLNKIVPGFEVQINAVSVVNFITAAGLSVEFAIHIMLKYTRYKGTRQERAKEALSVMGSSIVVGIMITKTLGVLILAFAPSTIFRLYYFRMYICLIILGSFHGLVFLPLALSWFGPNSVSSGRSYSISAEELLSGDSSQVIYNKYDGSRADLSTHEQADNSVWQTTKTITTTYKKVE